MSNAAERPVVVAFQRFGPYHRARLRAAARRFPVVGLELGTVDDYAWSHETARLDDQIVTVLPGENADRASPRRLAECLERVLASLAPLALAVPGWSQRCALSVLEVCRRYAIPAIVMSDSARDDVCRNRFSEAVKARVVDGFSAAFVAGTRHRDYALELGLPQSAIALGYDVVDNRHFAPGPANATGSFPGSDIPSVPYFLASSRFLERKNLLSLIRAFVRYRILAQAVTTWRLVLLGDGELRPALEAELQTLGLTDFVLMPGFKQYDELPQWYAAASCFIHPAKSEQWGLVVNEAMAAGLPVLVSERCGCAPDLVREGVNGFTFNPYDAQGMAELMFRMAHGSFDRAAMGRASRNIIADWGPQRFADGLEKAVEAALRIGPKRPGLLDQALIWALLRR